MRTIAAICLCAFVGASSFIPLSTDTKEKHVPWKSLHLSEKRTLSEPKTMLLTSSQLVSFAAAVPAVTAAAAVPAPRTAGSTSPSTTTTTIPVTYTATPNPSNGWGQVAICEEGGRNDPVMGYFGIIPQNWPAGESPANMDYAAQMQLANSLNGGSAPWCPPNCAAGGYTGW